MGYGNIKSCRVAKSRISGTGVCMHHAIQDVFVSSRKSFMRKCKNCTKGVMHKYSLVFKFSLFCQIFFLLPICSVHVMIGKKPVQQSITKTKWFEVPCPHDLLPHSNPPHFELYFRYFFSSFFLFFFFIFFDTQYAYFYC